MVPFGEKGYSAARSTGVTIRSRPRSPSRCSPRRQRGYRGGRATVLRSRRNGSSDHRRRGISRHGGHNHTRIRPIDHGDARSPTQTGVPILEINRQICRNGGRPLAPATRRASLNEGAIQAGPTSSSPAPGLAARRSGTSREYSKPMSDLATTTGGPPGPRTPTGWTTLCDGVLLVRRGSRSLSDNGRHVRATETIGSSWWSGREANTGKAHPEKVPEVAARRPRKPRTLARTDQSSIRRRY